MSRSDRLVNCADFSINCADFSIVIILNGWPWCIQWMYTMLLPCLLSDATTQLPSWGGREMEIEGGKEGRQDPELINYNSSITKTSSQREFL